MSCLAIEGLEGSVSVGTVFSYEYIKTVASTDRSSVIQVVLKGWSLTSGIRSTWELVSGPTPDLLNQILWGRGPETRVLMSPPDD